MLEQTVVEPNDMTPGDMRVGTEEESTDLPFIAERSKKPNTSKPNTNPDDPNVKFASLQKLPDLVAGTARMRQKGEQYCNSPISWSHQTRQRPFQEREWKWST